MTPPRLRPAHSGRRQRGTRSTHLRASDLSVWKDVGLPFSWNARHGFFSSKQMLPNDRHFSTLDVVHKIQPGQEASEDPHVSRCWLDNPENSFLHCVQLLLEQAAQEAPW